MDYFHVNNSQLIYESPAVAAAAPEIENEQFKEEPILLEDETQVKIFSIKYIYPV